MSRKPLLILMSPTYLTYHPIMLTQAWNTMSAPNCWPIYETCSPEAEVMKYCNNQTTFEKTKKNDLTSDIAVAEIVITDIAIPIQTATSFLDMGRKR